LFVKLFQDWAGSRTAALCWRKCFAEILFSRDDDRPPCANPALLGAVAHCDTPVLPELKISRRLRTGATAQSQSGDAIAAGTGLHAKKSIRIIQRISQEP
jgi:hypothetical protein